MCSSERIEVFESGNFAQSIGELFHFYLERRGWLRQKGTLKISWHFRILGNWESRKWHVPHKCLKSPWIQTPILNNLGGCVLLFPCLQSNAAFPNNFVWYLPICFSSIIVMKWHQECWSCSFLLTPISELICNWSSAFCVLKCWPWTDVNFSFYVDSTLNVLMPGWPILLRETELYFRNIFMLA